MTLEVLLESLQIYTMNLAIQKVPFASRRRGKVPSGVVGLSFRH